MGMKSPKIAKNDVLVTVARNEESPCFVSVATGNENKCRSPRAPVFAIAFDNIVGDLLSMNRVTKPNE